MIVGSCWGGKCSIHESDDRKKYETRVEVNLDFVLTCSDCNCRKVKSLTAMLHNSKLLSLMSSILFKTCPWQEMLLSNTFRIRAVSVIPNQSYPFSEIDFEIEVVIYDGDSVLS